MLRSFFTALLLLALSARVAAADDRDPPRGYVGVTGASLFFVGEAAIDGGFRPLADAGSVWIHAEVLSGSDVLGDFSSYDYRAALAGLELRGTQRIVRGVVGIDGGVIRIEHYDENQLADATIKSAFTWHAGGEISIKPAAIRFGLTGNARKPQIPMLTLGLSVGF